MTGAVLRNYVKKTEFKTLIFQSEIYLWRVWHEQEKMGYGHYGGGLCSGRGQGKDRHRKKEGHILTVKNPEEAIELAKRLKEEGFGAIEVCGAFGAELAKKMYEATDKTVPVGYVFTPEDELPQAVKFWSED